MFLQLKANFFLLMVWTWYLHILRVIILKIHDELNALDICLL